MIITTRQCVVCKYYVAESKIKVTAHTYSLCIGISCSAHNFIQHGKTGTLFGPNDHQEKTICPVQEPSCYVICIGLNESYSCLVHDFVVGPDPGMMQYRDVGFHSFVGSHQGTILLKALGGGISVPWTHFFLFQVFFFHEEPLFHFLPLHFPLITAYYPLAQQSCGGDIGSVPYVCM